MAASKRLSGADGRRPRAGAIAGVAFAAAALHLALLGGFRWTWDAPVPVDRPAPAVRLVRVEVARSPAVMPTTAVSEDPVAAVAAAPVATTPLPHAVPDSRPRRTLRAPTAERPPAVAAPPLPAPDPLDDDAPPPVYRTELPPPMWLRYALRRGPAEGDAELRWQRADDGYALDGRFRVGDAVVLAQSSRGGVDAAGIAPLRFLDQRPSRAAAAANFRRDVGRIGFSRKSADVALVPGVQDRLSWLLQTTAIVVADPSLRREGAEIRMAVAGAGGDVAVWRLRCLGEEPVATDAGTVSAWRYRRDVRGPYDTQAEIWIGIAEGRALPVSARWRSGPADDGLELRLRSAAAPDAE